MCAGRLQHAPAPCHLTAARFSGTRFHTNLIRVDSDIDTASRQDTIQETIRRVMDNSRIMAMLRVCTILGCGEGSP